MSIPDGEVYSLTAAAMSAAKRLAAVDYTGRSDELRRAVASELVWTINRLQGVIAVLDPGAPAADTRVRIPLPLDGRRTIVIPFMHRRKTALAAHQAVPVHGEGIELWAWACNRAVMQRRDELTFGETHADVLCPVCFDGQAVTRG